MATGPMTLGGALAEAISALWVNCTSWHGWTLAVCAVLFYNLVWARIMGGGAGGAAGRRATHQDKCDRIRQQVLAWNALPPHERRPLCTARSRSLTIRAIGLYKEQAQRISFADMTDVVWLDTQRRVVRCEPLIDMSQLAAYLVPKGWSIPVVPELKMLTVGGLVMGIGIESSSHRHGLFHNTVRACTILLADGTVKTVSRDADPDLFAGVFFSAGSWCFLLSVDIDVVQIPEYVRIDYTPYRSATDLIHGIERVTATSHTAQGPDFVEGLLFSPTSGALCVGRYVSAAEVKADDPARLHTVWWYSALYYAIVRDTWAGPQRAGYQYLSTTDYYFRHDRGLFWALELVGSAVHWFAFRAVFGKLLDYNAHIRDLFPSPVWSKSETETAWEKVRMVSDAVVPLRNAAKSFAELQALFEVYPVWLCPTRLFHPTEVNSHEWLLKVPRAPAAPGAPATATPEPQQYLDVGLYGPPQSAAYRRDHVYCQRAMEHITRREHGFMFPYSVGYSTASEFWQTFDKARYDALRARTGAVGAFVDLYTKLGGGDKITRWLAAHPDLAQATAPTPAPAAAAAADQKRE